jgi:hypothetical protein
MAKRKTVKATRPAPSAAGPATVHQLKVTLRDIRPLIWRRLQVPSDATLLDLHFVLQRAFDWDNSHLHEFEGGSSRAKRVRYGCPEPDDFMSSVPLLDEAEVSLAAALPAKGSGLLYRYDFGDDWKHDILVEKVLAAAPGVTRPRCLAGRRAGPPEDCGGPWSYEDFVAALADPNDEDHEERREWAGDFDPEVFDLTKVDAAVRAVFAGR